MAAAVAVACLCLSAALASADSQAQPGAPSVLRATYASFPDYMDPQLSYTQEGWTAMYDTYIPLLTYRHAAGREGAEVIPGLARSLPRITHGGRTYTLFLRRGLRYSNGAPVRASDFEYAVERMFRLYSDGTPFYSSIVGAERFRRKKSRGISGIVTNDKTGKIVIHLARPQGTFTQELALMFVPRCHRPRRCTTGAPILHRRRDRTRSPDPCQASAGPTPATRRGGATAS